MTAGGSAEFIRLYAFFSQGCAAITGFSDGVSRMNSALRPAEILASGFALHGLLPLRYGGRITMVKAVRNGIGYLFLVFASVCTLGQTTPKPLLRVHAHNDYQHTHPLFDALAHGFCSVEADVHLVDGRLLVAHDRSQVKPERTLEALYLDPLAERVKKNGGHVYPNGPEFTLLVEIKGDWKTSYPVVREVLQRYADLLTVFKDGVRETRAIRVIITGHRSREMFAGEKIRYASLDGDPVDLESKDSADLIPWISGNWYLNFKWRGNDPMPAEEKTRLKEFVAKAHQQGRRVRFWGAPDRPAFWAELYEDGVDLINTDDLAGAEKFLRSREE